MENEYNVERYESVLDLIYESYEDNDYDDRSISMNYLEDIWDGSYIHPDINTRYARLKIRNHIKQAQN